MSVLPDIAIISADIIDQSVSTSADTSIPREYAWDFENNTFLLVDGKFKIVTGKEALKIWIWKALHTMKMTYSIYSDNYGHDLDSIVGQGFSNGFVESEAKRLTWDCLKVNSHILEINNFTIKYTGDDLTVNFIALTDQGEVKISA